MHSIDPTILYSVIYPLIFLGGLITGAAVLAFTVAAIAYRKDGRTLLSAFVAFMTIGLVLIGCVFAILPVRLYVEDQDATGIALFLSGILLGNTIIYLARRPLIEFLK